MTEGFLYEPRSLWSIANVTADDAESQVVRLDRRHFFNGGRYPIQINRMAICAVNYLLFDLTTTGGGVPAGVGANESAAVINRVKVEISASQRYHFNTRRRALIASLSPMPTWQPSPVTPAGYTFFRQSSLWGQCNLDFDKPLILPREASIEWDLSAYTPWPNRQTGGGNDQTAPTYATMLWQEEGGLLPGSARSRRVALQAYTGDLSQPDPLDKWPYPVDGYGLGAAVAGIRPTTDWWAGLSRFPAAGGGDTEAPIQPATPQYSFAAQNATRAGSTRIVGMRTHIDQIDYDFDFADNFADNDRGPTPLSTRIGTRVRTVAGGSQEYWWREGAPLALVLDTITPASVYKLAEPITLGPGEQLDVSMEFPPNIANFSTTFHVGVAFNGFAAIEG